MEIASKTTGMVAGIELKVGLHNYPTINHKDPATAEQLRILRDDVGTIEFQEILAGDAVLELKKELKKKFPKSWPTELIKISGDKVPTKVFKVKKINDKTRKTEEIEVKNSKRVDFDKIDDKKAREFLKELQKPEEEVTNVRKAAGTTEKTVDENSGD
jgi:hypothetical protein